jgi:hypothetical protein
VSVIGWQPLPSVELDRRRVEKSTPPGPNHPRANWGMRPQNGMTWMSVELNKNLEYLDANPLWYRNYVSKCPVQWSLTTSPSWLMPGS